MIGPAGPLPGHEPIGACMGTCDHDRCQPDPCEECERHEWPCSNCAPPTDHWDAKGVDTHSDRAAYETEDFAPDPAGQRLWDEIPF